MDGQHDAEDLIAFSKSAYKDASQLSFKERFFTFCMGFVPKQFVSPLTALMLILLSFSQLIALAFGLEHDDQSLQDPIKRLLQVSRILPELQNINSSILYLGALYFVMFLLCLVTVRIVVSMLWQDGSSSTLLSSLTPFLYWFISTPISELFISIWECDNNGKHVALGIVCWKAQHLAYVCLSGFIFLLWISYFTLITFTSSYSLPHRLDPFGHFPSHFELFFTLVRVFLCVNVRLLKLEWLQLLLCYLTVLYLISLIWHTYPYYHPQVSWGFASGVWCYNVGAVTMGLRRVLEWYGMEMKNDIHMALIGFILSFLYTAWKKRQNYITLLANNPVLSEEVLDMKIHLLLNIMQAGIKYAPNQDFLLNHVQEIDYFSSALPYMLSSSSSGMHILPKPDLDIESSPSMPRFTDLALSLYEQHIQTHEHGLRVMIQMSGVYQVMAKNVYAAYTHLLQAELLDPELPLQFAIHCRKVELTVLSEVLLSKATRAFGHCRFISVIQFEAEQRHLDTTMNAAAVARVEFWRNLKTTPNLNYLHSQGLRIAALDHQVADSWHVLSEIYPRHLGFLRVYKRFVKHVLGQEDELRQLRRRILLATSERGTKLLGSDDAFSETTATILISGNPMTLGRILRASHSVASVFGYRRHDLIGRPLSVLMPSAIGNHHNEFLKSHFKMGLVRHRGKQFGTFGLDKDGYLLPINVTTQQLCSLKMGMLYVGAIKRQNETSSSEHILTDMDGRINGITGILSKMLHVDTLGLAEKDLRIQLLCPEIHDETVARIVGALTLKLIVQSNNDLVPSVNETARYRLPSGSRPSTTSLKSGPGLRIIERKCEIQNLEYSTGLMLKSFKIQRIYKDASGTEGKRCSISTDIMQPIATIMRALRKFKSILYHQRNRQKQSEDINPTQQSKLFPRRKMSRLHRVCSPIVAGVEGKRSGTKRRQTSNTLDTQFHSKPSHEIPNRDSVLATVARRHMTLMGSQVAAAAEFASAHLVKHNPGQEGETPDSMRPYHGQGRKTGTVSEASTRYGVFLKQMAAVRKLTIDKFYPTSIQVLKGMTLLFIGLILILLALRLSVSLWLNFTLAEYLPLIVANGERIECMGLIGRYAESIALFYPYGGTNYSIAANEGVHSQYNYAELLNSMNIDLPSATYKDYVVAALNNTIQRMKRAELEVNKKMYMFDETIRQLINPVNVRIGYWGQQGELYEYTMSFDTCVNMLSVVGGQLLEEFKAGTYETSANTTEFLIENTLARLSNFARPLADYILNESNKQLTMHESYSAIMLILISVMYSVYFLALIPPLIKINNNMSTSLRLLLDISAHSINEQLEHAATFKTKLNRGGDLGNILAAFREAPQEEADIDPDLEPLSEEGQQKKHGPSQSHKREASTYTSPVWRVLLIFAFVSCIEVAIFFTLDYFSKQLTIVLNAKIAELRLFSRALYTNVYNLPYLYRYIMTGKRGNCGPSTCEKYLPAYYASRMNEIDLVMLYHKGNSSLFNEEYNTLFQNIFENNPCVTTHFGERANCSTFLGGIFSKGTHITNMKYIDTGNSLFKDFQRLQGNISHITNYLRDPRLVTLEILNLQFLGPALKHMQDYQVDILPKDIAQTTLNLGLIFATFVVAFMASSAWWMWWLMGFLRKTLFEIKELLIRMPTSVIEGTPELYKNVSRMGRTCSAT